MSNEKQVTAEEYKEKFDNGLLAFVSNSLKTYGDLRAKEAVKEFAEELKSNAQIDDLDEITIPMYQLKRLAKQKGVKI